MENFCLRVVKAG